MPELPEVQTTVEGLNRIVIGKKIQDVWTDIAVSSPTLSHHAQTTKSVSFFNTFKKDIIGATIKSAERKGKNILIHLSNKKTIWIHMKMTGHLLYGSYVWEKKSNSWAPSPQEKNTALRDPFNRFLHTVFILSNNKQLVLSDVRKFAKITIVDTKDVAAQFKDLGPEPLDISFTQSLFKSQIQKRPEGAIKEVLLDQKIIAGIGNIYSDEMLWLASTHPLRLVKTISDTEFRELYKAMKKVLEEGIDFGGDSTSDYRDINGNRGKFQYRHNAYRNTKMPCKKKKCNGVIERIPFKGRGAHFCPVHQK